MPRKPRFFLPDVPAHIVQRGNNRQAVFFEREDYETLKEVLHTSALRYGCQLHAFVLMTNHIHLLVTPASEDSISRTIQYMGRHYVSYINKKYHRSGTMWEGRFKASAVGGTRYLMACYRYIEMNPVRAAMVQAPEEYEWSSYRSNGLGAADALITPHQAYFALGKTPIERAETYRRTFHSPTEERNSAIIREHTMSGTPLGSDRFRKEIEAALEVRVGKAAQGRPRVGED